MARLKAALLGLIVLCAPVSGSSADLDELARELADIKRRLVEIEKLLSQKPPDTEADAVLARIKRDLLSLEQLARKPSERKPEKKPPREEPPVEKPPEESSMKLPLKFGTVFGALSMPAAKNATVERWVYLDGLPGPLVQKQEQIEQRDRTFVPHMVVVQKGTRVKFPNRDSFYHNVFSLSPGNRFDLGSSVRGDDVESYRFLTTGIADIYCNTHAQMSAIVVVTPNDRRVRVDEQGKWTLDKIPAGTRRFVLVGSDHSLSHTTVEVLPDESAKVEFEISVARPELFRPDKTGGKREIPRGGS